MSRRPLLTLGLLLVIAITLLITFQTLGVRGGMAQVAGLFMGIGVGVFFYPNLLPARGEGGKAARK